jgi:ubiquinone/menaquinone biosynthesis C-methylase UbiE
MDKVFKPENKHKLDNEERRRMIPPESVLNLMEINSGETILDIGAGLGYFAIPALQYIGKTGNIIAADLSLEMLEELKKRIPENTENLEIIHCSPYKIEIVQKSIDKILMAFVFHEINEQKEYLMHLKPMLKDNGTIHIVEWEKTESPMGPPLHERLSVDDLSKIAKEAGYSIFKHHQINEYQYFCSLK